MIQHDKAIIDEKIVERLRKAIEFSDDDDVIAALQAILGD